MRPRPGARWPLPRSEKLLGPDWLANKIRKLQQENPGNDAKVMEGFHADLERIGFDFEFHGEHGEKQDTNFWQRILIASGGTSDGILKLVRDMDPLYSRLARIMTLPLPEYEDQMQKFDAEIQKSQNPLVPVIFPNPLISVGGPRRREFRIQTELAMVRAAVEYKLHGESGLKSVMDPCGNGPFAFQRFVFEGVDRGFELKSAYAGLSDFLTRTSLSRKRDLHFTLAADRSVLARRCSHDSPNKKLTGRTVPRWNCPHFSAIIEMCSA